MPAPWSLRRWDALRYLRLSFEVCYSLKGCCSSKMFKVKLFSLRGSLQRCSELQAECGLVVSSCVNCRHVEAVAVFKPDQLLDRVN